MRDIERAILLNDKNLKRKTDSCSRFILNKFNAEIFVIEMAFMELLSKDTHEYSTSQNSGVQQLAASFRQV
jgi:hypothetical protein